MILAIDIGNTNIVVGCIDENEIYFTERLSTVRTKTELEYAVDLKTILDIYQIKKKEIEGCIISSVVPQITNIAKLAVEKILKKKVRKPSIKKLKESEMAAAMKALLDQGYSQDAVSEAFQCFPSTVRRRVRKLTERKETNDRSEIDCRNI